MRRYDWDEATVSTERVYERIARPRSGRDRVGG
jgi:hypothetical protein